MSYYGEQTYCYNCRIPSSGHSFVVPQTCRKYACNNNFKKSVIFKDSEIGPIRENETIIYESEITEEINPFDQFLYAKYKVKKKQIVFYSCCVYCEDCWQKIHSFVSLENMFSRDIHGYLNKIDKIYKKIGDFYIEVKILDYETPKIHCPYCKNEYNENNTISDNDLVNEGDNNYTEHYYEEYIEDIRTILNSYLIHDISNIILDYIIIYAN